MMYKILQLLIGLLSKKHLFSTLSTSTLSSISTFISRIIFISFAANTLSSIVLAIDVSPSIHYPGNEGSIRQVIAILMDNAIKYCDEEGQISVTLHSSGKRRNAKLTVSNTYSAIDALDIKHIFDRFYRQNKARESSNSFGLGLSIAKSIMEQHKGNLTCCKGAEKQILFTATFKK